MKNAESQQRTTCFIKKLLTDSHSTGWYKGGGEQQGSSILTGLLRPSRLCSIIDDVVVTHKYFSKNLILRSTQRLFCTLVEESVFNWLVR